MEVDVLPFHPSWTWLVGHNCNRKPTQFHLRGGDKNRKMHDSNGFEARIRTEPIVKFFAVPGRGIIPLIGKHDRFQGIG